MGESPVELDAGARRHGGHGGTVAGAKTTPETLLLLRQALDGMRFAMAQNQSP